MWLGIVETLETNREGTPGERVYRDG